MAFIFLFPGRVFYFQAFYRYTDSKHPKNGKVGGVDAADAQWRRPQIIVAQYFERGPSECGGSTETRGHFLSGIHNLEISFFLTLLLWGYCFPVCTGPCCRAGTFGRIRLAVRHQLQRRCKSKNPELFSLPSFQHCVCVVDPEWFFPDPATNFRSSGYNPYYFAHIWKLL